MPGVLTVRSGKERPADRVGEMGPSKKEVRKRNTTNRKEEGIMSVELVREYLKEWGAEDRIQEFDVSSACLLYTSRCV